MDFEGHFFKESELLNEIYENKIEGIFELWTQFVEAPKLGVYTNNSFQIRCERIKCILDVMQGVCVVFHYN